MSCDTMDKLVGLDNLMLQVDTSSVEISRGPTKAMGNIMLNPVLLHISNDGIYT